MLIAAVLHRQSSCRETRGRWLQRTDTRWSNQNRSLCNLCDFFFASKSFSILLFAVFIVLRRVDLFFLLPTWNDRSSRCLANGYCGGSRLVDYPSSPSELHGRARRRPYFAGWMCLKQRWTLSTDEDGDKDDALVSLAVGELILDVRALSPPHKPFSYTAKNIFL